VILFLDFDGVLHPATATDDDAFCHSVLFWQLLREFPNIEVVFSTSWRGTHQFEQLVELATRGGGEDLVSRFIGATPSVLQEKGAFISGPYHRRYNECRLWMIGNGLLGREWIALDDDSKSFPAGCLNLVLCNGEGGFSERELVAIRNRMA